MKPEIFGEELESELKKTAICVNQNTPYFRLSKEILEMASAYRKDGISFFNSGDLVNAHASFAYGFGWLDFGVIAGLLKGDVPAERLPVFDDNMPDNLLPHLFEKTNRYRRMLFEAVNSVAVSPDKESPLHDFSLLILKSASEHLSDGDSFLSEKKYVNALGHFSYGYGLLDAAVRCGLLTITGDRSLFTV
ncbi:MAG: DUF357 domain-containing protein [Methanomicrobiaceae archaeon]|nr:DUF357 domain-containing protein [Methanomicrobiaceae archaeon]